MRLWAKSPHNQNFCKLQFNYYKKYKKKLSTYNWHKNCETMLKQISKHYSMKWIGIPPRACLLAPYKHEYVFHARAAFFSFLLNERISAIIHRRYDTARSFCVHRLRRNTGHFRENRVTVLETYPIACRHRATRKKNRVRTACYINSSITYIIKREFVLKTI